MGFGFSLKDVENRILAYFMEEGEELRKQLRFSSPSSSNLPSRTIPSDLTKLPLHQKAVHPHLVRAATSALNKLHLQSMLFKFRAFYPQVSKTLFPVWCWVLLPRTCPYTCCCICLSLHFTTQFKIIWDSEDPRFFGHCDTLLLHGYYSMYYHFSVLSHTSWYLQSAQALPQTSPTL